MDRELNINNADTLNEKKQRLHLIDKWRFILMIFAGISIMDFLTSYGKFIQIIVGSAVMTFYVLSGFLVFAE